MVLVLDLPHPTFGFRERDAICLDIQSGVRSSTRKSPFALSAALRWAWFRNLPKPIEKSNGIYRRSNNSRSIWTPLIWPTMQILEEKVSGGAGGMGIARQGEECQHNLVGAKFPLILPSGYYIMLSVWCLWFALIYRWVAFFSALPRLKTVKLRESNANCLMGF